MHFHRAAAALQRKIDFPDLHDSNILGLGVARARLHRSCEVELLHLSPPRLTTAVTESVNDPAEPRHFLFLLFLEVNATIIRCHRSHAGQELQLNTDAL